MPVNLRDETRIARKVHLCSMCNATINIGDRHHVATNIHDGRAYDWRTCEACRRDRIVSEVWDFWGQPDEGVDIQSAHDWAHDLTGGEPGADKARAWLVRFGCTCDRCPGADS